LAFRDPNAILIAPKIAPIKNPVTYVFGIHPHSALTNPITASTPVIKRTAIPLVLIVI
jgi:hypothetical protein